MSVCDICYEYTTGHANLERLHEWVCCRVGLRTWFENCERSFPNDPGCAEKYCSALAKVGKGKHWTRERWTRNCRPGSGKINAIGTRILVFNIERQDWCDAVMCICVYRFCCVCKASDVCLGYCHHTDFSGNISGIDSAGSREVASADELNHLQRSTGTWRSFFLSDEKTTLNTGSIAEEKNMEENAYMQSWNPFSTTKSSKGTVDGGCNRERWRIVEEQDYVEYLGLTCIGELFLIEPCHRHQISRIVLHDRCATRFRQMHALLCFFLPHRPLAVR